MESTATCSADDCERPVYCKGICLAHYTRLRRTGSLGTEPIHPYRASNPTYSTVHDRLRRERGPATAFRCMCGQQASNWAYTFQDPNPMVSTQPGTEGAEFSTDLTLYIPLCRSCHVYIDHKRKRAA